MGTWRALDYFENEAKAPPCAACPCDPPPLCVGAGVPTAPPRLPASLARQVLSNLRHPNIPRFIDSFECDRPNDKLFHLVQVAAPGQSLSDLVRSGFRPTAVEAEAILTDLLSALEHLTTFCPPLVHRDVTPANVVFDRPTRRVSLVDFGFAAGERPGGGSRLASAIVGTYGFMAPEQFRGEVISRGGKSRPGRRASLLSACARSPFSRLVCAVAQLASVSIRSKALSAGIHQSRPLRTVRRRPLTPRAAPSRPG